MTILGTGFGPYTARVIDGFFPFNPPPAVADPITLLVGDVVTAPAWSGAAAGYAGLAATRFKLTEHMPGSPNMGLRITVQGQISNTVLLPMP